MTSKKTKVKHAAGFTKMNTSSQHLVMKGAKPLIALAAAYDSTSSYISMRRTVEKKSLLNQPLYIITLFDMRSVKDKHTMVPYIWGECPLQVTCQPIPPPFLSCVDSTAIHTLRCLAVGRKVGTVL